MDEIESKKSVPPFTSLPSFNCAAIILSYLDYDETVSHMMQLLSKNATQYMISHNSILVDFLVKMEYEIKETLAFGWNGECNCEFNPVQDNWDNTNKSRIMEMNLSQIRYQFLGQNLRFADDYACLAAMGFEFQTN